MLNATDGATEPTPAIEDGGKFVPVPEVVCAEALMDANGSVSVTRTSALKTLRQAPVRLCTYTS
jgi:hypothetical protein